MQQLFGFGISVLDMILCMIFFDSFLERFKRIHRWQMYLYAVFLGGMQAYLVGFVEMVIQQIMLYIVLHILAGILFVDAFRVVWLSFVIFTFVRIAVLFGVRGAVVFVCRDTYFAEQMEQVEAWIAIVIQVLFIYYVRMFRRQKEGEKKKLYWKMLLFPGVGLFLVMFFLKWQSMQQKLDESIVWYILFIVIMATVLCYFLVERVEASYEFTIHQKLFERQNEEYKGRYYERLEDQQKAIRTIRHDMKNQLLGILGELENGNADRARSELEGILKEIEETTAIFYTSNPGMNAVLDFKTEEMKRKQISFSCKTDIPTELRIEARDLGILVGNMLDNAIEACEKCLGKRYISFEAVYHNHSLVIMCENSTAGYVEHLQTEKKIKKLMESELEV